MKEGMLMYAKLKSVDLHYEVYGEGVPILMIHGFSPDMNLMKGCMEPFFKKSKLAFKRIYIDLPGMGETKHYHDLKSTDDILNTILEFISNQLKGESFLIAGESYGGYLTRGIITKLKTQILGVFLICPLILPDHSKRRLANKSIIEKDETFLATLSDVVLQDFEDNCVILTKETFGRWQDEIISGIKIADELFLTKIRRNYSFSSWFSEPIFNKPTVFLLGQQDDVVGYHDALSISSNYQNSTFAVINGAGHNLQIEKPKLFNAFVSDWLHRCSQPE
ncbi:alpha/beta fold hydrolase [Paenibacillus sp. FA6]|uniref:alpha/beta fold hydrolase n=1 Tax=Paenibacillus sp. FA6 TaxID=3413029 RepID=UPI003F65E96F